MAVKSYTFVDYATQGYIAIVAGLILCGHRHNVPMWPWLLVGHLVALAAIHALIIGHSRRPAVRVLSFFRHFYPVLLYAGFYAETGALDQMFVQGYLDPVILHWDQALFGFQPSLVFMRRLPYLPISELFYAAYFSYYLMIGGVGLILYLQNRRQFFHYVSVVSFVFYICYLIFIFVPVVGPPIFFRTIPGYQLPPDLQALKASAHDPLAIQAGVFYRLMKWIYQVFEAPGAAIPSSHVAVALCTVFFSFRYIRRIRWGHLALAVLLCLATVYCHYHYASDVLAGIVTAALLIPLANWLYFRIAPPAASPAVMHERASGAKGAPEP